MPLQLFVLLLRQKQVESPTTLGVIDISYSIHFCDNDKSSSISELINSKSRNLQKLLKYFNKQHFWVWSNVLLSSGVLPIIFVLYLKDLLFILLCCYFIVIINFFLIIIYFKSIIILQLSYNNCLYILTDYALA